MTKPVDFSVVLTTEKETKCFEIYLESNYTESLPLETYKVCPKLFLKTVTGMDTDICENNDNLWNTIFFHV